MVPSVMDSPICGIRTSVPGPPVVGALPCVAAGVSTAAGATLSAAGAAAVSACAGEAAGAEDDTEPAPSIVQTIVLIWTVVPSGILISFKVPAAGEGISASTLSVDISKSGSPR